MLQNLTNKFIKVECLNTNTVRQNKQKISMIIIFSVCLPLVDGGSSTSISKVGTRSSAGS